MSAAAHRFKAAQHAVAADVAIGLLTVSDSRTAETDVNGLWLNDAAAALGHSVRAAQIVPDDPALIDAALSALLVAGCRIVVVNGGTGISRRDNTADVVLRRFDKLLPGFGEALRTLSWTSIGSAAILSRAAAGTMGNAVVFALPGSPDAVRLAWERLIAPEIAHLVWEMDR